MLTKRQCLIIIKSELIGRCSARSVIALVPVLLPLFEHYGSQFFV